MTTKKFTDESLMPFGMYKGRQMADVPAEYLLYIYEHDMCLGWVKLYIEENLGVIETQIARAKKSKTT